MKRNLQIRFLRTEQGDILTIDPESSNQMIHSFTQKIEQMSQLGIRPIILTSAGIRMYVRQMMERTLADIPILSYNELEPNVEVQSVGVVNL